MFEFSNQGFDCCVHIHQRQELSVFLQLVWQLHVHKWSIHEVQYAENPGFLQKAGPFQPLGCLHPEMISSLKMERRHVPYHIIESLLYIICIN